MIGVLEVLVGAPALFAVLTLVATRRDDALAVSVALLGAVATALWSLVAWSRSGDAGFGATEVDRSWVAALDLRWHLGWDGISGPLVVMTTVVLCCAVGSLLRQPPSGGGAGRLAALLLLIEAGVLGSFLALDLVLFFAFFEVALVPMWFVIDRWGDATGRHGVELRRKAATRFLVFTVTGSSLMLVGFVLVHAQAGTFDIVALTSSYRPDGPVGLAAAVLVALGLAVKAPLWPLHIWLPDAHATAPTVGSVVLAAVLLKLGTYGFVRFWLPLTDPGQGVLVPVVAGCAVVGIVYAALACLAATDLKRLVAYSSVGHMGFVVLAVCTFTTTGVQAAVFASVAHGLITGLLFFLAGTVKQRYGTGDLRRLRGLYGRLPHLAGVVAFAAMASLGLPGLAGFWGEMLTVRAALSPAPDLPRSTFVVLAVVAALGVILTSAYVLALLRTLLQGPAGAAAPVPTDLDEPGPDAVASEWAVWSPLIALTVLLGVAPGLLLTPVGRAAVALVGQG